MKVLVFILSLFCCYAMADDSIPPAVKAFEKQGIKIIRQVKMPGGMPVWLGEYQGSGITIFMAPDGKHAISGYLYDDQGNNLSQQLFSKELYAPQGRKFWQAMKNAHPIKEGNSSATRQIFVFADPYCPYCKEFWAAAQPWISAGKVQLNTLLVAILTPKSGQVASAILNSSDPASAWHDYELSGGKKIPAPTTATPPAITGQLQYNQQLMDQLGANGTPAIYYMDENNELQQVIGMPDTDQLTSIFGPLN